MVVILLGVGLATSLTTGGVLLPALVYLGLNTIESQFVTPHMVGRTLTLNPLAVFVTIVFWLWLWGPVGGLIAVPSLMVVRVVWTRALAPGIKARSGAKFSRNPGRGAAFAGQSAADVAAPQLKENLMNWDQIEGKWKEMTGKVQQHWGELSENDIQEAKGDRRELAGKIQHRYGITKDEAERQIDEWSARV
jgi:uncharacterized protein YjbJ (UPF0337 family)